MKYALIWKYHELAHSLNAKTFPSGWLAIQWEMERVKDILQRRYEYDVSLTLKTD